MRLPYLTFTVTLLAVCWAASSCQQAPGMQGGIVDNGNKPGDNRSDPSHTPSSSRGPRDEIGPPGNVLDNTRLSVLGDRHVITYLPTGFTTRQSGNDKTDILDTPNMDAPAAATLTLDADFTACNAEPSLILTTLDGGQLYPCLEMTYELKAKNGDRIIVRNYTLEKEVLYSILKSLSSK